ncbi:pilus assembly protein CpaB [Jannaschia faecimaris]|uniref:Pilus assembly protein CpaB n=1 Tax=Jannaschia faecimaris TaxID=1244108 RepID=A0A1H3L490_9RHOB|nr:Flp pilus assembly protein CpaB [Jannaschia faecimaris]SDY58705.1 pilus assembly protein CpaB [Jannaschia faecimaris]
MRLIFGLLLLAGLGLAGFAVNTAKDRFNQYQNALVRTQQAVVPVRDVFVVKRQMSYGDVLGPNDVRAVSWPADAIPDGTFNSLDAIFPPDNDGQRTVLRVMERDEAILLTKVTKPGQEAGLATSLTPGMRAFTLQVDVNSGVSGFLRPGDRVDVYWTGGSSEGSVTRLIHANLPLIAIDQKTDSERSGPTVARNITVEVTPEVVAKLAQAQATGRLALALVGVRDETESPTVEATLDQILGPREVAPIIQRQEACTIRTRKGADVDLIQIPCTENG